MATNNKKILKNFYNGWFIVLENKKLFLENKYTFQNIIIYNTLKVGFENVNLPETILKWFSNIKNVFKLKKELLKSNIDVEKKIKETKEFLKLKGIKPTKKGLIWYLIDNSPFIYDVLKVYVLHNKDKSIYWNEGQIIDLISTLKWTDLIYLIN